MTAALTRRRWLLLAATSLSACAPLARMRRAPLGAVLDTVPAGLATSALAVGAPAPVVEAESTAGRWVLAEQWAQGPVVVLFFRGTWCGYCRAQLEEMQAHLAAFLTVGARVAAVSVDPVDISRTMVGELGLGFPVVADPQRTAIQAFGVDDARLEVAWPATFVVTRPGVVAWRSLTDSYKKRPPADATLEALQALSVVGG